MGGAVGARLRCHMEKYHEESGDLATREVTSTRPLIVEHTLLDTLEVLK